MFGEEKRKETKYIYVYIYIYIYIKEKIKSKRAKRKEKKNNVCADVVTTYRSVDHTVNMQLDVTIHLLAVGGITVEGVHKKPLFIY